MVDVLYGFPYAGYEELALPRHAVVDLIPGRHLHQILGIFDIVLVGVLPYVFATEGIFPCLVGTIGRQTFQQGLLVFKTWVINHPLKGCLAFFDNVWRGLVIMGQGAGSHEDLEGVYA